MDTARYLTKAAAAIEKWEQAVRDRDSKHRWTTSPDQAEKIARAWIELAAIERGVTPTPANPEES